MWLLDAKTIQLREFADNEIPRYAILSHTWGSITEEVTFADMLEAAERASAGDEKPHIETAKKTGFFKIESSCRQALADEIDYVWVDTCCINKNSLTDLSEAINSMFRWYQGARVCYAFLADVPPKTPSEKWLRHLYAARWFQRGWTLQELLAPPDVRFYSKDWTFIGTRSKMRHTIARITGIDVAYLDGKDLRHASVAKKMSWASQRTTTRLEDTAYCLLGIFNVNMPLLYGEGNKAFLRLQEEIIKDSEDQSIFAWGSRQPWSGALRLRGLFARSPAEFAESGDIVPSPGLLSSNPYALTNRGLRIEL
ncbi:HET-domain-containing protein, partial [Trichodelitschia bisporula]